MLSRPVRYQLDKVALQVLSSGHPWIFRNRLSTAVHGFKSGQLLDLVDGGNQSVGHGIYERDGLIGIRTLRSEIKPFSPDSWRSQIQRVLARRQSLRKYTDAFRAVHGENDGFPGVVVDVYGETLVTQTYAPSMDLWGRYITYLVAAELGSKNLLWKPPTKRVGPQGASQSNGIRCLRGQIPDLVRFHEGPINLVADLKSGQKSGTFLDLRGLRKWVSLQPLNGKRVLNLYSYTGMLGLAAELAGAKEVLNVDVAKPALEFAQKFHRQNPQKQRYIQANIFEWLAQFQEAPKSTFNLIIVDPPGMTSRKELVPQTLRTYSKLYREAAKHVSSNGWIVACCCTSRVGRAEFRRSVSNGLGSGFDFVRELGPEDDHPVSYPEGDYLKISIFKKRS